MKAVDESAFSAFVTSRGDALLRFARLLVPDPVEAEDVLQVALLRLTRHWSRRLESPEAYVRATLVNLARDRSRRRHLVAEPVAVMEWRLPATPDPADALVAQSQLDALLSMLPTRQRLAVVLRTIEGLSEKETAAAMGCSAGTVKSSLARGLRRLREVLDMATASREVSG